MKVTLLHVTPLSVAIHAARTCYDSFDKGDEEGDKDKTLLNRIIVNSNHGSIFEHCNFTFYIEGTTRGTLQELVRHRHSYQEADFPEWNGREWSPSVKSTRYTLKELKKEAPFWEDNIVNIYSEVPVIYPYSHYYKRASQFIALPVKDILKRYALQQLEILRKAVAEGYPNDEVKDLIPDCYLTNLTMTINGRSLRNFLSLRTSNKAYWRIRDLANEIYRAIPNSYKFLFEDIMCNESK